MSDPKDPAIVSTYKPATEIDPGSDTQIKPNARLTDSGVPESLWEPEVDKNAGAPFTQWQAYPKPLREPALPHSDKKPGDLFRHVERTHEDIEIPEGPLGGPKKTKDKENKTKIPMW